LCAGSITAFSLYGPLFITRLNYSQFRVNEIALAAEFATYLPVPIFGYICDRYTPGPASLISALLFGPGYILAAFAYKSGPPPDAGGDGWPFWVMVLSFIGIGAGTCSLYLASVATCAKNFGHGKHKGFMLAVPIAAFGMSGMWQSQVGTRLLYESGPNGERGDVDVFKYFLFLGVVLAVVGLIGTFALRVVDEEEMIDEAVEELERSGILGQSDFFRSRAEVSAAVNSANSSGAGTYGTFGDEDEEDTVSLAVSQEEWGTSQKEDKRKKEWLLNRETRLFLKDRTMWWLAGGFFLVTGPGEAYINNLGTIIHTLTPASHSPALPPPAGLSSTHVATIALTSTIARLLTGSLSDIFAPSPPQPYLQPNQTPPSTTTLSPASSLTLLPSHTRISRLAFLITSALLLSTGFLLLASPLTLAQPSYFHATTALVGLGYGATFSLVPIIISVVWGVENFGTNWGIVAMTPALGAAVWGSVYSVLYEAAKPKYGFGEPTVPNGTCRGWRCYGFWAAGCMGSVLVAAVLWAVAWRVWRRRGVVV
ncbi:hypothetical protein AJ80_09191, partial [Polytolypa hystricis UAMH7299]